mmetsp:Transcript_1834/g.5522  ORF Transcript_1834/g.5522 Transcript_1834/m.5522 type:complete len:209 (+) Transcript_1834:516-1142(+)
MEFAHGPLHAAGPNGGHVADLAFHAGLALHRTVAHVLEAVGTPRLVVQGAVRLAAGASGAGPVLHARTHGRHAHAHHLAHAFALHHGHGRHLAHALAHVAEAAHALPHAHVLHGVHAAHAALPAHVRRHAAAHHAAHTSHAAAHHATRAAWPHAAVHAALGHAAAHHAAHAAVVPVAAAAGCRVAAALEHLVEVPEEVLLIAVGVVVL